MNGIIFDLDGTLLDTLLDLHAAVNFALSQFGYPQRSLDEVRQFVGNGAARLISLSVPENTDPAPVLAVFQGYYAQHCDENTAPYPGIMEALEQLKKDYALAIVSNKPDYAVKELCARLFPGIPAWGEGADCPRKPAPDMVHRAMKALDLERCLYVGDSEVDILTAWNAGIDCLSVTWGFRSGQELTEAGALHYCHAPKDLPAVIDTLFFDPNTLEI